MRNRSKQRPRARQWATAAVLALSLGGCGGGGVVDTCPAGTTGSPPNCRAIPPLCVQSQLLQTSVMLPARWLIYDDFSVPEDGRLDITLDWTNPESPMGFYLVPVGTCNLEEFNDRTCDFLVRGEPAGQKPRQLLAQVNAGNYRWIVGNLQDDVDESASLQIVLSTGECPVPGGAAALAASGQPATTPPSVPQEGLRRH